ncbi:MAG: sensor histidine kinase [Opitutaceae bacterium]
MPDPAAPSRRWPAPMLGGAVLTILIFGAVVALVTGQMQAGLREQILRREADALAAVAALQVDTRAAEYGALPLAEIPGALLVTVLQAARYRGVVAVRVFDGQGNLNASDGIIGELPPPALEDWRRVVAGEAFARLSAVPPGDVLLVPAEDSGLVLEAWVPLRRSGVVGVAGAAQFWLESGAALRELGGHDRRLWVQALAGWSVGSLVIGLGLAWAFRRLTVMNAQLRARSADLERANRELILAAKTSALGTVTAHLIHELKNPLAGLELFVAGQADAGREEDGRELAEASALTRRLRTMVNDVVAVLRDEQSAGAFLLPVEEVAALALAKVREEARARGVSLEMSGAGGIELAGRRANLAVLVLRNLLQNAIEAQPAGGWVRVATRVGARGEVEFRVEDGGGGLPESVRSRLFQPCASGKPGGSGLGLALSQQLALQAGGSLQLERSDATGTCFRLVLAGEA